MRTLPTESDGAGMNPVDVLRKTIYWLTSGSGLESHVNTACLLPLCAARFCGAAGGMVSRGVALACWLKSLLLKFVSTAATL